MTYRNQVIFGSVSIRNELQLFFLQQLHPWPNSTLHHWPLVTNPTWLLSAKPLTVVVYIAKRGQRINDSQVNLQYRYFNLFLFGCSFFWSDFVNSSFNFFISFGFWCNREPKTHQFFSSDFLSIRVWKEIDLSLHYALCSMDSIWLIGHSLILFIITFYSNTQ